MADYSIKVLTDAFDVLKALALADRPQGFAEIERSLKMNKTRLFRILSTLSDMNVVEYVDGLYVLSWQLFDMGQSVVTSRGFRFNTHEVLQNLSDLTAETANLGILMGHDIMFVDVIEFQSYLRTYVKIGTKLPAWCTSIGKAILFDWSDNMMRGFFSEVDFMRDRRHGPASVEEFIEQIASFRSQGYSLDDEEYVEGVRCVAAPLWDYTGHIIAAVSISAPKVRLTDEKLEECIPHVLQSAQKISSRLGGEKYWNAFYETSCMPLLHRKQDGFLGKKVSPVKS